MRIDPTLRWLRNVVPAGCGVAGGPIGQPGPSPHPEEELIVANAVAKRRYEFRAGRSYARSALAEIGCSPSKILQEPGGAPAWPAGHRGSIAHMDTFALAVAGQGACLRGIGLDIEAAEPLDEKLKPFVCLPQELKAAPSWFPLTLDYPKLLFVAKEAFMKLHYAMAGSPIDFNEVVILPGEACGEYTARTLVSRKPQDTLKGQVARGHMAWDGGIFAAIMYVHTGDGLGYPITTDRAAAPLTK